MEANSNSRLSKTKVCHLLMDVWVSFKDHSKICNNS